MIALPQSPVAELGSMQAATRLATAALVGLAVGIEREWSGHATGPDARFAGLRTFLLFGILGGTAGILFDVGGQYLSGALGAGASLFVVASYVMAARRPASNLDGTTEAAALVVLGLGALAGVGQLGLAAGAGAVVVFALGEKARLHWLVRHVGEKEMRAALQFAVLALVILPVLPEGPYLPVVQLRPRLLWGIVVLLSGINFAGYLARRAVGATRGYGIAGLIGGIISSTAVTLQFSRRSRDLEAHSALAIGVIGACSVLPLRVIVISSLLDPKVGQSMLLYLAPSAVVGFAMVGLALRGAAAPGEAASPEDGSPLRLRSAIQMALLFQAAMTGLTLTSAYWGQRGLAATAVLLGLTDVDALTVSMTQAANATIASAIAAWAITIGILSNTVFKAGVVLLVGRGRYRLMTIGGLAVLAIAMGVALALVPHA